ncbi:MAG: efflux RND transporter periplasmic adaptor subunit [Alphaproteobacteria bacterium]|nr:efflux RND transporter periplasmic adaptor subunit [Alphaproteobacteria bacterium]
MKVKKIKSSNILGKVIYSLVCCAFGWYLHSKFTPSFASDFGNEMPQVLVTSLKTTDIAAKKKYIAQVEAINSVDIMPQVSGYLEEILFKDGAFVNKDDNIFIIEQRRYRADLKSAEALVKQLQNEYYRVKSLHEKKYVSDRELDLAESNLSQAEAALDQARLNLEHTEIKSPISGIIGKALVTKGNLVGSNTQKLARIVQTSPIRIAFSVSDKERTEFMQQARDSNNTKVDIVLPNGEIESANAQSLFFDNEVNPDTATIPVYIDSENKDNLLVPGNYVDIYFSFGSPNPVLLVPQMALSSDVSGTYVMVASDDGTITRQYLELGDVIDDMQVVKSGLNGDEKVVIQGLQKVSNGMKAGITDVSNTGK